MTFNPPPAPPGPPPGEPGPGQQPGGYQPAPNYGQQGGQYQPPPQQQPNYGQQGGQYQPPQQGQPYAPQHGQQYQQQGQQGPQQGQWSQQPGQWGPPARSKPAFDFGSVNPLDWGILAVGLLVFIFSFVSFYSGAEVDCGSGRTGSTDSGSWTAWHRIFGGGFFAWFAMLFVIIGAVFVALSVFAPRVRLPFSARTASFVLFVLAALFEFIAIFVTPGATVDGGFGLGSCDVSVNHGVGFWLSLVLVAIGAALAVTRYQQTGGNVAALFSGFSQKKSTGVYGPPQNYPGQPGHQQQGYQQNYQQQGYQQQAPAGYQSPPSYQQQGYQPQPPPGGYEPPAGQQQPSYQPPPQQPSYQPPPPQQPGYQPPTQQGEQPSHSNRPPLGEEPTQAFTPQPGEQPPPGYGPPQHYGEQPPQGYQPPPQQGEQPPQGYQPPPQH